ncbi:hypothetical protein GCM10011383_44910 [Hymenobacter cavernae]|uniref:Uncharacterized protein n=1 Tax=Hymenobacter cavernae TaxID=2044852 RepID=A0ABQ1UY15_9BACT|nr:hypothetical protein GCM10011383_44910 [Hymenobacter cavernae]
MRTGIQPVALRFYSCTRVLAADEWFQLRGIADYVSSKRDLVFGYKGLCKADAIDWLFAPPVLNEGVALRVSLSEHLFDE